MIMKAVIEMYQLTNKVSTKLQEMYYHPPIYNLQ